MARNLINFSFITQSSPGLSNRHTNCLQVIYTFVRVTQDMNPEMGSAIQLRLSIRSHKQIPTMKAVHIRSCIRIALIFRIFFYSHEICCRFRQILNKNCTCRRLILVKFGYQISYPVDYQIPIVSLYITPNLTLTASRNIC